jgi:hypothetical protein
MRTTLDIAEDVFFAAKDCARRDHKSMGQIISEWARMGLMPAGQTVQSAGDAHVPPSSNADIDRRFLEKGFKPLSSRGGVVTNEMIDALREAEGI